MNYVEIFLAIIVPLLLLSGAALLVAQKRWIDHLRRRHRLTWEKIGRPSLVNSIEVQVQVFKFIRRREYLNCNDVALNDITRIMVRLLVVYVILFLFAIAFGFAFLGGGAG